ncbi:hypothetical protein SOVF_053760 [Spinacia oleracea]|nr:hypothetical protein SOVF_053760 [Spinacia oleracea]
MFPTAHRCCSSTVASLLFHTVASLLLVSYRRTPRTSIISFLKFVRRISAGMGDALRSSGGHPVMPR